MNANMTPIAFTILGWLRDQTLLRRSTAPQVLTTNYLDPFPLDLAPTH